MGPQPNKLCTVPGVNFGVGAAETLKNVEQLTHIPLVEEENRRWLKATDYLCMKLNGGRGDGADELRHSVGEGHELGGQNLAVDACLIGLVGHRHR